MAKKTDLIGSEETLALKLVRSKHWRWLPGMLTVSGIRIIHAKKDDYVSGYSYKTPQGMRDIKDDDIPDLTDPCTMGGLLTLVREAWDDPGLGCFASYRRDGAWLVYNCKPSNTAFAIRVATNHAPSEVAALANALIHAP